ncbi:MAG: hypothetical protein MK135_02500 [Polyangiaceae bacterium]|nr:hypothetical protein [Polyangiaceae bacterium]
MHQLLAPPIHELERLVSGDHHDPHSILGIHEAKDGRKLVRGYHPDAEECVLIDADGAETSMFPLGDGLFGTLIESAPATFHYSLRFRFSSGETWERQDPYSFLPTLGEQDLYLFGEGTHRRLTDAFGARVIEVDGVKGTAFSVWAPNARRASVVGDFCSWDGRLFPMRSLGSSGVWEIFLPGVSPGAFYKYELRAQNGDLRLKVDPVGQCMEMPPGQSSIVHDSEFIWSDDEWMTQREGRDHLCSPINIYELHLGSWARNVEDGNRSLSYREIAPRLASYVRDLGYTHVVYNRLRPVHWTPRKKTTKNIYT